MGTDCDNMTSYCRVNAIQKKIYGDHEECRTECDNIENCSGYAYDKNSKWSALCYVYGDVTAPNRDWSTIRRTKTIVWSSTGAKETVQCYKRSVRNFFTKQF